MGPTWSERLRIKDPQRFQVFWGSPLNQLLLFSRQSTRAQILPSNPRVSRLPQTLAQSATREDGDLGDLAAWR